MCKVVGILPGTKYLVYDELILTASSSQRPPTSSIAKKTVVSS